MIHSTWLYQKVTIWRTIFMKVTCLCAKKTFKKQTYLLHTSPSLNASRWAQFNAFAIKTIVKTYWFILLYYTIRTRARSLYAAVACDVYIPQNLNDSANTLHICYTCLLHSNTRILACNRPCGRLLYAKYVQIRVTCSAKCIRAAPEKWSHIIKN